MFAADRQCFILSDAEFLPLIRLCGDHFLLFTEVQKSGNYSFQFVYLFNLFISIQSVLIHFINSIIFLYFKKINHDYKNTVGKLALASGINHRLQKKIRIAMFSAWCCFGGEIFHYQTRFLKAWGGG